MTAIAGSLELITNPGQPDATSVGLPVAAMTVAMAPMFAAMVWGIADLAEAPLDTKDGEPVVGQVAVWTGTAAQLRPCRVILWEETEPQPREIEGETP